MPEKISFYKDKPLIPNSKARKYEARAELREKLQKAALDGAWMAIEWGPKDPKTAAGRRNMVRLAAKEVELEIAFTRWGWAYKGHSIVRVTGRTPQ